MATDNLQVSASADDAYEIAAGTVYTNTDYLYGDAGMWAGVRFQNVAPARGATISLATLELYVYSTGSDDARLDVYGEDEDDAAAFAASSNNISSRTPTTAKVDADDDAIAAGGEVWYSITVTAIVQEIVNRGSWASGNALAFLLQGMTGGDLAFRPYEYTGNANGAKLTIEYSTQQSGSVELAADLGLAGQGAAQGAGAAGLGTALGLASQGAAQGAGAAGLGTALGVTGQGAAQGAGATGLGADLWVAGQGAAQGAGAAALGALLALAGRGAAQGAGAVALIVTPMVTPAGQADTGAEQIFTIRDALQVVAGAAAAAGVGMEVVGAVQVSATAVIVWVTPTSRTLVVAAEDRTLVVAAEDRTLTV